MCLKFYKLLFLLAVILLLPGLPFAFADADGGDQWEEEQEDLNKPEAAWPFDRKAAQKKPLTDFNDCSDKDNWVACVIANSNQENRHCRRKERATPKGQIESDPELYLKFSNATTALLSTNTGKHILKKTMSCDLGWIKKNYDLPIANVVKLENQCRMLKEQPTTCFKFEAISVGEILHGVPNIKNARVWSQERKIVWSDPVDGLMSWSSSGHTNLMEVFAKDGVDREEFLQNKLLIHQIAAHEHFISLDALDRISYLDFAQLFLLKSSDPRLRFQNLFIGPNGEFLPYDREISIKDITRNDQWAENFNNAVNNPFVAPALSALRAFQGEKWLLGELESEEFTNLSAEYKFMDNLYNPKKCVQLVKQISQGFFRKKLSCRLYTDYMDIASNEPLMLNNLFRSTHTNFENKTRSEARYDKLSKTLNDDQIAFLDRILYPLKTHELLSYADAAIKFLADTEVIIEGKKTNLCSLLVRPVLKYDPNRKSKGPRPECKSTCG